MNNSFIATQADTAIAPFTPDPIFTSSSPRTVVAINGKRYVPVEIEVNGNAHGATGDASITLPIGGNADFSVELQRGDQIPLGGGFTTSDNSPVFAEIYLGFPNPIATGSTDISQMIRVFLGVVDMYSAMFHDDAVTFSCRSLAAPLVDDDLTRITMNETSLQFAQAAADYAGLKLVTQIAVSPVTVQEVLASQFVGGYNFAAAIYKRKWWDMLLQCAMFDDADVWVDQDTLYYASPSLIPRTTIDLKYGRDIEVSGGLTGTHSVQFSKNVQVELHTYNRKTRKSTSVKHASSADGGYVTQTRTRDVTSSPVFGTSDIVTTSTDQDGSVTVTNAQSSGGGFNVSTSQGRESGKERYIRFVPNVAPDKLARLAKTMWRQISEQEYSVDFSVPLRPNNLSTMNAMTTLLKIAGCPYQKFNDTYYPRSRTLRVSNTEGGGWQFKAVNHQLAQSAV